MTDLGSAGFRTFWGTLGARTAEHRAEHLNVWEFSYFQKRKPRRSVGASCLWDRPMPARVTRSTDPKWGDPMLV